MVAALEAGIGVEVGPFPEGCPNGVEWIEFLFFSETMEEVDDGTIEKTLCEILFVSLVYRQFEAKGFKGLLQKGVGVGDLLKARAIQEIEAVF